MSKNIKKNLPMVIASNCFSKAHKKGIAEKFKNRYNQSECVINIINKNNNLNLGGGGYFTPLLIFP